jgi:hypothetical protein
MLLGAAEAFRRSPVAGAGAERTYAARLEQRCQSALGAPGFERPSMPAAGSPPTRPSLSPSRGST